MTTEMTNTSTSSFILNLTQMTTEANTDNNHTSPGSHLPFDIKYDPTPCYSIYCIFELRYRQDNYTILMCIAIMLGILGTVGFVGNSLVLTVLLRAKMKQTSVYFMVMLSILDLMACVVVIPGIVITEWHFPFPSDFLCKFWEAIRYFTIPTSAMVLVAIAFDRCIVICFAPRRMSKNVTFMIISLILLIGICLGVLPALVMGVYSSNGIYFGYCIPNYQYISLESLNKYWLGITSIFILMIITIIIFYSSIFFTVLLQNRKWSKIRSQGLQTSANNANKPSTSKDKQTDNSKELRRRSSTNDVMFATRASEKLLKVPQNSRIHPETTTDYDTVQRVHIDCPMESALETEIEDIEETPVTSANKNSSKQNSSLTNEKLPKKQTVKISPINITDIKKETETSSKNKCTIKQNNKTLSPTNTRSHLIKTSRKTHIKTTQVLFTVTMVYIVSFLPTFLIANDLLPEFKGRKVIYLMYFLNNTANPLIYSFMNPMFRKQVWKFLQCKSR